MPAEKRFASAGGFFVILMQCLAMARKNTSIYVVALLCLLGGLGWLCYTGFSESSVYFLNVAEASTLTPEKLAQARLFGVVSENDLTRQPGELSFLLADKDIASQTIPVHFSGLVPDTFKAGAEVIVEGAMSADGRFLAATLMTKCPSKYQKANRQ